MQPNGSIDTTGDTRTGEDGPPLEGQLRQGWNLDRNAIMLAQYAVAFDRSGRARAGHRGGAVSRSRVRSYCRHCRADWLSMGANGQTALD